jgi:hypothetical protein
LTAPPTNPEHPLCDLNAMRQGAAAQVDAQGRVDFVSVEIDGIPSKNLGDYRVQSPAMSLTYPDDNVIASITGLPVPSGTNTPNVSDGYFLIIAPLSTGKHTIRIKIAGFSSDGIYNSPLPGSSVHVS